MFTNITTCNTFLILTPHHPQQSPWRDFTQNDAKRLTSHSTPVGITLRLQSGVGGGGWFGDRVLHIIELFTLWNTKFRQQFNRDFAKSQTCLQGGRRVGAKDVSILNLLQSFPRPGRSFISICKAVRHQKSQPKLFDGHPLDSSSSSSFPNTSRSCHFARYHPATRRLSHHAGKQSATCSSSM